MSRTEGEGKHLEDQMYAEFGHMIWTTKSGKRIRIQDMSPEHLKNAIKALEDKSSELQKAIELKKDVDRTIFILKQYQIHKQEEYEQISNTHHWDGNDH